MRLAAIGALLFWANVAHAQPLAPGKPATLPAALRTNEVYIITVPLIGAGLIAWAIFSGGPQSSNSTASK